MLKSVNNKIIMSHGDFGSVLPFTITDITLDSNEDKILFEIKKAPNSYTVLSKVYSNKLESLREIQFDLSFTKEETARLPRGSYVYYVRHIRDDELRDTLLEDKLFEVK